MLYLDEVRVPADALIGESVESGLPALFSGLNPERITVAAMSIGTARYALARASAYASSRSVWGRPIGSHQGVAHPLAHATIQVELARLMVAKAASLYDLGRDVEAGVAANMAKYASAEAAALAVDTAIQVHGGNGMTTEYGVATLLGGVRAGRIAPVSREMILNFVAQHVLGQEKSY
jgi:alkylation response protein AidB-like acyl-CoA dehydrogenase